jgi:hypothetical protein
MNRYRPGLIFTLAACATTCLLAPCAALAQQAAANVDYPIVYVRAPRAGDTTANNWPEVFNAVKAEPGSSLMLLHPSGGEEILFDAGNGAVVDPSVTFDARQVYFSYFPDMRPSALNTQRGDAPRFGADIYRIDVQTREIVRLTHQEFDPPTGAANWSTQLLNATPPGTTYLGYGIFNLGPQPLPGGRVVFSSNREMYWSNQQWAFPNLRLYVMDDDGRNLEAIGHLNIGSALHPTVLADGRIMFSSWEGEALHDPRTWGLWAIRPDGTAWEPLFSALNSAVALHFQAQFSDRRIGVVDYYNLNNFGFGSLLAFALGPRADGALHGDPLLSHPSNPPVRRGIWYFQPGHPSHLQPRYTSYRFSPTNLVALSGFTTGEDAAASYDTSGVFAGKVTHPSAAPDNDVLVVWSPGPVNRLDRPTPLPYPDGGLYLIDNAQALTDWRQLLVIKNLPQWNEQQPRALVPYQRIYGIAEPARLPELANDGGTQTALPAGTPFGLVGTSSFYRRNTKPAGTNPNFEGWDAFNTTENESNPNWFTQGAEAGKYANPDIWAVRIIAMEGVAAKSYGPFGNVIGFRQHGGIERYRILGEIPLRKQDGQGQTVLDPDGNPDTSFRARIPADVSFTFQTLDRDGLVLNMAQTWHQVRPGETRTDCGGCHAHAQAPLDYALTAAGRGDPTAPLYDLTGQVPLISKNAQGEPTLRTVPARSVSVEYHRDIKPILQRSCAGCHSGANPPGRLRLDDESVLQGYDRTWHRLANDSAGAEGYRPLIGSWRQTNTSRYIRAFQARRSLLVWKIFGRRLDGWTNASHPTESVPGDATTLPPGVQANNADLDYTGTIMPPPGSGVPALSEDEKILIARWIDLGAPVDASDATDASVGWMHDEAKPTLTLASPERKRYATALARITLGAYDVGSGLNWSTLSVRANFAVNGRPADTELADLFPAAVDHVRSVAINPPLAQMQDAEVTVRVRDVRGNTQTIVRRFDVDTSTLFNNGFE